MTSINDVYHPRRNLLAYRLERTACHPVTILADDEISDKDLIKPNALVMEAGGYARIDGIGCVHVDRPGLYRLHRLSDSACTQWIVRDADIVTFAASVASIFYHAALEPPELTMNNAESMRKMYDYFLANAPNGKVGGVCITAANAFAVLCLEAGYDAVLWEFQDVESDFGPIKSHVMTEVGNPADGQRILVDIDRKFILQDAAGKPLNCLDYVQYSVAGRPYAIVPISGAKIAGFGATDRMPKVLDFEEELFELADDAYREEVVRSIGKSLLIKGIRYHDRFSVFTLPDQRDRIGNFLTSAAGASVSEKERLYLTSVLQYPEAAF